MTHNIPIPCSKTIQYYLDEWGKLEKYALQERALNYLFSQACPSNKDIAHVILKVSTLNDFYSTNIYDTFSVSRHIVSIKNFHDRLKRGDPSLVNDVAKVRIKEKEINFYSFASKYCSHHSPSYFPIYDSYVEKMLWHYKQATEFKIFKKYELKNYNVFLDTIHCFQHFFDLKKFSLRDIDIFLWLAGKKYFPNKY